MSILDQLRIGIDMADEREMIELMKEPRALERVFTTAEIADCMARGEDAALAFARRFAAKEALIKAASHPEGRFATIEITHDETGQPIAKWLHLEETHCSARISVSSARPFAIAVAIIADSSEPRL